VRVGARGVATEDVEHPWLSIECKFRAKLPAWIKKGMAQAVGAAGEDKLPIVVLHQKGAHLPDDFVLIRFGDFRDWFVSEGGSNGETPTD
jgi:hypothetical protein